MKSLQDRLPLRSSTSWDAYRTAEWLPIRYGACGGRCVQYDASRRLWVWNDRPSAAIEKVFVRGLLVTNYEWRNAVDKTGHAVTMIEFAEAIEEGADVVARGRGAIHHASGVLIENPADVLYDVLVNMGGLAYAQARFDEFRVAAADTPVGGSIERNDRAIDVANSLCASIGAVFSPDMPDLSRTYPLVLGAARVLVHDGRKLEVSATMARDDICNDLTIRYAHEAGTPRGAVQYDVPASVALLGRVPDEVDAPWVTEGRVAAAVAERTLAVRARQRWLVTVGGVEGEVLTGQYAHLNHSMLPGIVGAFLIESSDYDEVSDRSTITLVAPAEPVPRLRFIRNPLASSAIEPQTATAAAVNNEYGFVVVDDQDRPVPGALCILDPLGVNMPRRSDSSGWVSWPRHAMTPGQHTVVAQFDGRSVTIILEVP